MEGRKGGVVKVAVNMMCSDTEEVALGGDMEVNIIEMALSLVMVLRGRT